MTAPYDILDRLRADEELSDDDLRAVVAGTTDGSWGDAQLGAFLMGVAVRGLDARAAGVLTRAMTASGDCWSLGEAWHQRHGDSAPLLGDKHSTGGVGDKVSLVIGPLLAACDQPIVMLTGRGLGHTAGTADKLETIPGLRQDVDRQRALDILEVARFAVGVPTAAIAPADGRLYALRDVTATVQSIPLVVASILSKKLASGASTLVLDVKVGSGAFFPQIEDARSLARLLVATGNRLGIRTSALLTDMSQPLGRWAGHAVEVRESVDCLEGRGPDDLMEVVYRQAEELSAISGRPLDRRRLVSAITSGAARERFDLWAEAQGAEAGWLARPSFDEAPVEVVIEAPRTGVLAVIDNRRLGLLLCAAGGGRRQPEDEIDLGVGFQTRARLGDRLNEGDELIRLFLRREDDALAERFAACFTVAEDGQAPPLVYERIGPPEEAVS